MFGTSFFLKRGWQEIGTLRQYVETNTTALRGREVVSKCPGMEGATKRFAGNRDAS